MSYNESVHMLLRMPLLIVAFLFLCGPSDSAAAEPIDSASDEPPVVRSVSTGTWGFWGFGGYMRQYSELKNTWNVGIGLRAPSGGFETTLDLGFFSHKGLPTLVKENAADIFGNNYRYSTFFYRARGVYIYKPRHINIPGVLSMRFPLTLRMGAGLGVYQITTTVEETVWDVLYAVRSAYRRTERFQRVEPMLEFGVSKALSNVLDAQLSFEHVFSRGKIGKDSFQYGGPSMLLRFSYRFF